MSPGGSQPETTDAELQSSEAAVRGVFDQATIGMAILEPSGHFSRVNRAYCEYLGYTAGELLKRHFDIVIHPEDLNGVRARFEQLRSGAVNEYRHERRYRHRQGHSVWGIAGLTVLRDPSGDVDGFLVQVQDITDRKAAEDALRRAYDELEQAVERRKTELVREIEERKEAEETLRVRDEQLHLLTDNLPQMFAYIDGNGRYAFANKACETRYGLTREDIIRRRPEDVHGAESYAKLRPYIDAALDGRLVNFEEVVRYPDGNTVHARITYAPHFQSSGMVSGYVALSEDVTELKRTGELLQQAQKMEAVGQLTGGVAHDFNNLLAVIMGNSELLTLRLGENDSLLTPIIRATKRGSELTRRLLAFSRQQPLAPRIVNLGALVSGMNEMLGRTLGATIEIEAVVGPGLSNALADPGQVENALLNLALNARDAMAGGGKLTIECANADLDQDYADKNPGARAGAYVSLAVTDDGRGMSQEEQARAFEPFFTTK